MRSRVLSWFVAVALLLAAGTARAGILLRATWLQVDPVTGTLGFPMSRTRAQLSASGTSTATSIAVDLVYPAFSSNFFVPKTTFGVLDFAVKISQGGPQHITASPSMGAATRGIPGTVIVMTANHLAMGVNASMFATGINTLAKVPVNIGVAEQVTSMFTIIGAPHTITVDFYAWTPHTKTFTGLTTKGVALPNVVAMGSFDLTTRHGFGHVTLVSPTKVGIDGDLARRRNASFTTLKMFFFPEPGTPLLLGAVALGLGRRLVRTL